MGVGVSGDILGSNYPAWAFVFCYPSVENGARTLKIEPQKHGFPEILSRSVDFRGRGIPRTKCPGGLLLTKVFSRDIAENPDQK